MYVAPRCYAPSSFLRFSGQFSCRRLAVDVLGVCICAVFEGELRGVGVSLLNGVVERRLAVSTPRVCAAAEVWRGWFVIRVVGCGFAVFGGLPLLLLGVRPGGAAYVESGCVLRLPAVFLYGLLFVVVGCLVRLSWFLWFLCCLAWAVGVFGCAAVGAAACRHRWVYLGCWGGVRVFISGGFVCLWSLRRLGGVLWSF